MFNIVRKAFTRTGSAQWLVDHHVSGGDGVRTYVQGRSSGPMQSVNWAARTPDEVSRQDPAYNERVLYVAQGAVEERTIRDPLPFNGEGVNFGMSAGRATLAELDEKLAFARRVLERCTPWVTAVLAPRVRWDTQVGYPNGKKEIVNAYRGGGAVLTDDGEGFTVVKTDTDFGFFRDAFHHESWHQLEHRLSDEGNRRLREALGPWQFAGASDYTLEPIERLANAYAAFAIQSDSLYGGDGQHIPLPRGGRMGVVFEAWSVLYSGEYARTMRAHGLL